jgi:hypothetical protein
VEGAEEEEGADEEEEEEEEPANNGVKANKQTVRGAPNQTEDEE